MHSICAAVRLHAADILRQAYQLSTHSNADLTLRPKMSECTVCMDVYDATILAPRNTCLREPQHGAHRLPAQFGQLRPCSLRCVRTHAAPALQHFQWGVRIHVGLSHYRRGKPLLRRCWYRSPLSGCSLLRHGCIHPRLVYRTINLAHARRCPCRARCQGRGNMRCKNVCAAAAQHTAGHLARTRTRQCASTLLCTASLTATTVAGDTSLNTPAPPNPPETYGCRRPQYACAPCQACSK